jgi:hypothetical protein
MQKHRGAFEYDWRARFHLPLSAIPAEMGWDETKRLLQILAADPTSHVCAAISKWQHPASWEYIALADLIDVQVQSKSKKRQKRYRRPWDKRTVVHGKGNAVSIATWRAMKARQITKPERS